MLVLSRSRDQQIVIGTVPPIYITVIDVRGGKVRLGFEAPKHVRVDRLEVSLERSRNA